MTASMSPKCRATRPAVVLPTCRMPRPGEQAGEAAGLAVLDALEEVVRLLLADAFLRDELVAAVLEPVDVAEALQQLGLVKLVHKLLAQPVDVHLVAGNEPLQPFADLGGALRIGAVAAGLVLRLDPVGVVEELLARLDDDGRVALGALLRRLDRMSALLTLLLLDADDLGDDLAGLLDDDGVAFVQVEAGDLADVVHGGVLHGGAGDEDGLHHGPRGDAAVLPDLPVHLLERGHGLLGGVLVGDAPAGGFARVAQRLLQVVAIDLEHHAVGLVAELVALGVEVGDVVPRIVEAGEGLDLGVYRAGRGF